MGKKRKGGKVASLKMVRKRLDELVPADYNPRTISNDALAGLGRSVDEFGYVDPIVWNRRTDRVVSGHQRLKVLARRGVEEVDVVEVDLDVARERALNVAMNSEAIQGEWDRPGLATLLEDLRGHDALEGLFGGLRMDVLLAGLPSPPVPPEAFPQVGEDLETEHRCPKCGYEWSGKKK